VPFRNSKLTHLLSDSLAQRDTARFFMLLQVAPALSNVNDSLSIRETLSTLQFGSRLNSVAISSHSRRSVESLEQNRL
jgi:hypothetical protein